MWVVKDLLNMKQICEEERPVETNSKVTFMWIFYDAGWINTLTSWKAGFLYNFLPEKKDFLFQFHKKITRLDHDFSFVSKYI